MAGRRPQRDRRLLAGGPTGRRAKALRRTRAVDPAAAAIRQAKMLLFAPQALTGKQAPAPAGARRDSRRTTDRRRHPDQRSPTRSRRCRSPRRAGRTATCASTGSTRDPEPFINELMRLIPLLPDRGLILDLRGNPGGYIWAAELALQLFTPKPHPADPLLGARHTVHARHGRPRVARRRSRSRGRLARRRRAQRRAVLADRSRSPIPTRATAIGQQYGGPVVLVSDSTTYSAGDLFAAGFVDNGIGPFVCVGEATGAGGANVWDYAELRSALAGSPIAWINARAAISTKLASSLCKVAVAPSVVSGPDVEPSSCTARVAARVAMPVTSATRACRASRSASQLAPSPVNATSSAIATASLTRNDEYHRPRCFARVLPNGRAAIVCYFENTVARDFLRAVCTTLASMMVFFLLSAAAIGSGGQAPADQSLRGRLASVQPGLRRITVLPEGDIRLSDVFIADHSEVRQGDREVTLSDLVLLVGRRVKVRYRLDGDRRIAASVIVEPEGGARSLAPATRPSPLHSARRTRHASDNGRARTTASTRFPSARSSSE